MDWKIVSEIKPQSGIEVLGYHPSWEDPDYNKSGVCLCTLQEALPDYWMIAKWCGYHDEWHTRYSKEAEVSLGDAPESQPYIEAPLKWIEKPV